MHHRSVGHRLEHHTGQVRGGAVALAAEGDLSGIGFDVGNQLLERVRRQLLAHDRDIGHRANQRERHKLKRFVGELSIQALVDRERSRRAQQQRVTVRLGLVGQIGADIAAGAGPILDHDRLLPSCLQLLANDASQHVIDAAAWEGDDEFYRAGGKVRLRCSKARNERRSTSDDPCYRHSCHALLPVKIVCAQAYSSPRTRIGGKQTPLSITTASLLHRAEQETQTKVYHASGIVAWRAAHVEAWRRFSSVSRQ